MKYRKLMRKKVKPDLRLTRQFFRIPPSCERLFVGDLLMSFSQKASPRSFSKIVFSYVAIAEHQQIIQNMLEGIRIDPEVQREVQKFH